METLDRHALVTAVWLPAVLVAAMLLHHGIGVGSAVWMGAGFGAIVAGYLGHVLVNVTHGTGFSPRELALGLVLYLAALTTFVLAALVSRPFAARAFAPLSFGFLLLFAVVVFTMLTRSGVRGAFAEFDVIRSFRPAVARGGASVADGQDR